MMIYVITNVIRNFCCVLFYLSIVTLEWLTVTLQGVHRRRNHVVSKAKTSKNIQILSSSLLTLSREDLPFHLELLWLSSHLQISYDVNPSVECWSIFQMLSNLETRVHHILVLLWRRIHFDFSLTRRIIYRFSHFGIFVMSKPSMSMTGIYSHDFMKAKFLHLCIDIEKDVSLLQLYGLTSNCNTKIRTKKIFDKWVPQ